MADDDLDDQYLVRKAIEDIKIRHEFVTVNNGSQLLDLLLGRHTTTPKIFNPDFILLDLNMPLLDGFETLIQLKGNRQTSDIPVFVLSTSRSDQDRDRAIELGALDFYVKPARYADLKRIMGDIWLKAAKQDKPSVTAVS